MIEEVEIENYRNIDHLSFKANKLTVIIGKNRSGKTSILNAICFGLTGADQDITAIRCGGDVAIVRMKIDGEEVEGKIYKKFELCTDEEKQFIMECVEKFLKRIEELAKKDKKVREHKERFSKFLNPEYVFNYLMKSPGAIFKVNGKFYGISDFYYWSLYRVRFFLAYAEYLRINTKKFRECNYVDFASVIEFYDKHEKLDRKLCENKWFKEFINKIVKEYNILENIKEITPGNKFFFKVDKKEYCLTIYDLSFSEIAMLYVINELSRYITANKDNKELKNEVLLIDNVDLFFYDKYLDIIAKIIAEIKDKVDQVFITAYRDEILKYLEKHVDKNELAVVRL